MKKVRSKKHVKKSDKKVKSLWRRFVEMTPQQRNDLMQSFFGSKAVDTKVKMPMELRIELFKATIKSGELSAKFMELDVAPEDKLNYGDKEDARFTKVPKKGKPDTAEK